MINCSGKVDEKATQLHAIASLKVKLTRVFFMKSSEKKVSNHQCCDIHGGGGCPMNLICQCDSRFILLAPCFLLVAEIGQCVSTPGPLERNFSR